MRRGIQLDKNKDLLITPRRVDGKIVYGLTVADSDSQNILLLLSTNHGDIKAYPALGADLEGDLKSMQSQSEIERRIKVVLQSDGYGSANVKMVNEKITVDYENK